MVSNHLDILIKQEDDMTITCTISEIAKNIADLIKRLLDAQWYQPRICLQIQKSWTRNIASSNKGISLPSFTPLWINKENLHKQHNVCQQCLSKTNMATKLIFLALSPFPRRNRSKIYHILSQICKLGMEDYSLCTV